MPLGSPPFPVTSGGGSSRTPHAYRVTVAPTSSRASLSGLATE